MRFSIRDVLWLTLTAAVVFAWLADRRNLLTEVADKKWLVHSLSYFLAERGFEVRTWEGGCDVLDHGEVVHSSPYRKRSANVLWAELSTPPPQDSPNP